ncbi:MAG: hypothetical protein DYG89_12680 [Caldilinea sp. CFX5]|nr:hypothetical protein [Caldilinea sp. CFX5]
MTIALACTWQPRGERTRFQQLRPQLAQLYSQIILVAPATAGEQALADAHALAAEPHLSVVISPAPPASRYLALQTAWQRSTATHIHYADLDRLLRWVETRPAEWRQTVAALPQHDCLIIGRTAQAFATHPQALQQTEMIINRVFTHHFGQVVDLGGGSRGYSRRCVEHLLAHSRPGPWDDAHWPMLLQQAGFRLAYLAVDGLDWESADRYRSQAADEVLQRTIADIYDADPAHWARRVQIALEIIEAGLTSALPTR